MKLVIGALKKHLLFFVFFLALFTIHYSLFTTSAFAQTIDDVFGKVVAPSPIQALGSGSQGINNVLNKGVLLLFTVAAILAVFMVIISAFQWITSGGDKEAVGNARKRLTYAIIGIVLLALTFLILNLLGQFLGFTIFEGQVDLSKVRGR